MIGKTRQGPAQKRSAIERPAPERPARELTADIEEVFDPEVGQARGMLRRALPGGKMRHSRRRPSSDLTPWIAHYWLIHWDLRGCDPHVAESVPHPNIHLVFENGGSVVCGVQTHKFSRLLKGESRVFGIKFRPGGFRPFYRAPVSGLADRIIPAHRVFGKDLKPLDDILLSSCKESEKVEAANAFFQARKPQTDPAIVLASQLVDRILQNPEIKTVDDLVRVAGMGKRSLQRLFSEYVGVSPKWVIRRYRLHELIEKFNAGGEPDWPQLALELGYFDQAHLINDFKSIVGHSPTEYQKLLGRNS
jgi:AraC-like DNA-binding protein